MRAICQRGQAERAGAVDDPKLTCDGLTVRELVVGALVLFIAVGVPLGVYVWARWLARRPGATKLMVFLPRLVGSVAVLNVIVAGVMGAMVVRDMDGDPSERATTLAKGISEAINCYAFGIVVVLAIALLLVPLTIAGRRRNSASGSARH